MTLSILLYAMMILSLGSAVGVLVYDAVRARLRGAPPVRAAAPARPCVPGRRRSRSVTPGRTVRAGRGRGASSLRRR